MNTTHFLPLLLALAAGCGNNPTFSDDEGAPRAGGGDELSQPYALGTKVMLSVKALSAAQASSFQVTSDAPNIFAITKLTIDGTNLTAECSAPGEGDTTIHLLDGSGADRHSAKVSVRAPDKARVYAHGTLRILGNNAAAFAGAEVQELRVLTGSNGVFPIAYFRGQERVWGRGLLTPDVAAGVAAKNVTSSGAPSNEWLFVTPSVAGTTMLNVKVAGQTLASLPLIGASEADLSAVSLLTEQGTLKDDKQQVWVYPDVRDTAGHPVSGVYGAFTLDGTPQTGKDDTKKTSGDLFRFEFQPGGAPRTLSMTHGSLHATTTIQAHDGWVSDTTYLGCSVGGHRGAMNPLFVLALVGFALMAAGRRRRVPSSAPRGRNSTEPPANQGR